MGKKSRSGSAIRIRDPDPRSGSAMNILDHISESLETIYWGRILKFFDAHADSDSEFFSTLDPGSEIDKFGSGMENIRIRGGKHSDPR
jgi:hypothetical protein